MKDLSIYIGIGGGDRTVLGCVRRSHATALSHCQVPAYLPLQLEGGQGVGGEGDILQNRVYLTGTCAEYATHTPRNTMCNHQIQGLCLFGLGKSGAFITGKLMRGTSRASDPCRY